MKNYMKKNGIASIPEFPKKKFFFAKTKAFIDARIKNINNYFLSLFGAFPQKVPFTNALIDLCQPLRLSVAVLGAHRSGKSSIIRAFARVLIEREEFQREFQRRELNTSTNIHHPLHASADFNMVVE